MNILGFNNVFAVNRSGCNRGHLFIQMNDYYDLPFFFSIYYSDYSKYLALILFILSQNIKKFDIFT